MTAFSSRTRVLLPPAAVATPCELMFPVTAFAVNALVLSAAPTGHQVIGIVMLMGALAFMRHRSAPAVETLASTPVPPAPPTSSAPALSAG